MDNSACRRIDQSKTIDGSPGAVSSLLLAQLITCHLSSCARLPCTRSDQGKGASLTILAIVLVIGLFDFLIFSIRASGVPFAIRFPNSTITCLSKSLSAARGILPVSCSFLMNSRHEGLKGDGANNIGAQQRCWDYSYLLQGTPVEATEQLNGAMVAIYWHAGQWLLDSLGSAESSHPFPVVRDSSFIGRPHFAFTFPLLLGRR